MDLTRHARARMQQRGIAAAALDALLDYGRVVRAGRGVDIVYFDKRSRERFNRATVVAPANAGAQRICKTYAIVASDGSVITVGHRTRRIPR
ncbi:MAG TPA: DUF4258 domain-containing protein [Casimicrobiaceae bacterium]|nr:DUF4258 domain-containing protein [Casimicrobiaceae bacterium]